MSFFGFNTTLPRDKPLGGAPHSRGMFEQHDPFGGLGPADEDAGEVLNFDDTYDGLGQQLDESGDTFNVDTFGADGPATRQSVGKDFDFAGETAKMRGELLEEQALHHARQPLRLTRPAPSTRTGYEAYKEPDYIPRLEADASIWGKPTATKSAEPRAAEAPSTGGRKMMSLEEVETMMRAQAKPQPPPAPELDQQSQGLRDALGVGGVAPKPQGQEQRKMPVQILQRPQQPSHTPKNQSSYPSGPQILQRQQGPTTSPSQHPPQQRHMQHPSMGSAPPGKMNQGGGALPQHARGPSQPGAPLMRAQPQMAAMSPEAREALLAEEAKRAKRNHKILLLSKHNGVMTPQDKNFITRIQLQQLLTATGGLDHEAGHEDRLAEDFYYQVYAQIRGPPRSGPGQPLNQFAQTYLFQTGSRYGYGRSRHHPRGGDNHVQRMEKQVARAVEAAKARPKSKSLVVEGSLGKIAFSNSKTPRPLLNIKRTESTAAGDGNNHNKARIKSTATDRKAALRDIERIYGCLMRLEDHERRLPPPPQEDSAAEVIEGHMKWRSQMQTLNQKLWESLKVMEPIQSNPATPHPFIAILSYGKGKKAVPRVFRHLDEQQRLTMLTLVMIHLDVLDVVRDGQPPADGSGVPGRVREEIDLFDQAVMPALFGFVNEAPLAIVIGLTGLVLERTATAGLLRTRIGVSVLTMLVSRAELLTQPLARPSEGDRTGWSQLYGRLFDVAEPMLPVLFPVTTSSSGQQHPAAAMATEDVYVWQFLAAMGVGASPEQQQRLVVGVKDRVMETVRMSQTLPPEMRERRRGEVNLFMRAIGLDVELLQLG